MVHLRPFTVLAGPSNSGKSYLASLVYALHSFFAGSHRLGIMGPGLFHGRGLDALNYLLATRENFVTGGEAATVSKWARSTFLIHEVASQQDGHYRVSIPQSILRHVNTLFAALGDIFNRELTYCMGVTNSHELRTVNSREPTQLSIYDVSKKSKTSRDSPLVIRMQDSTWVFEVGRSHLKDNFEFSIGSEDFHHLQKLCSRLLATPPQRRDVPTSELIVQLADLILKKYLSHFGHKSVYFPAARHGATILYKTLLREAMQRRDTRQGSRHFPGTISDFISTLLELGNAVSDPVPRTKRVLTSIDTNILEGTLEVDSNILYGLHDFKYRPKDRKLLIPLSRVASMVSSLAPVALFVRYLADSGSVIIIEEPEAHMHPRKQVALTRELAYLVKQGINVLITTHSKWMLEELTNIVKRSDNGEAGSISESVDRISLSKAEVGVWHFKKSETGHTTRIVRAFSGPNGLYDVGYHDVALDVYNEWLQIDLERGSTK